MYKRQDLGSRTLGIAVSDPLGMIARTVETFRFADDDYDAACARAVQLAKELGAVKFVLGLPKHMNLSLIHISTVVRALTALFKKLYPYQRIACCAPTGRAAKRLAELTETDTFTIHSLLGWDLESNTFTKTEQDPLIVDLLIIDEFSMVDSWLFAALCKALSLIHI